MFVCFSIVIWAYSTKLTFAVIQNGVSSYPFFNSNKINEEELNLFSFYKVLKTVQLSESSPIVWKWTHFR